MALRLTPGGLFSLETQMKIEIGPEVEDEVVRTILKQCIEAKQRYINNNADRAVDGELEEDIRALWHLMHAYNYFSYPEDHYDIPL